MGKMFQLYEMDDSLEKTVRLPIYYFIFAGYPRITHFYLVTLVSSFLNKNYILLQHFCHLTPVG
jgi:hypothetical protein